MYLSSNIDNCLKININLLSLQEKVTKKPFLVLVVLILWRDIGKIHTPTHKLVPNTNLIFSVTRKKIDTTTRLWVPYFSTDPSPLIWHGNKALYKQTIYQIWCQNVKMEWRYKALFTTFMLLANQIAVLAGTLFPKSPLMRGESRIFVKQRGESRIFMEQWKCCE